MRPTRAVYTARERGAALLCFVLGLFFVRYFLWFPLGCFSTLYIWALVAVCRWFMRGAGIALRPRDRRNALLVCAFALVFSLTDNGAVKFAAEWFVLFAGAYWVFAACERRDAPGAELGGDILGALVLRPFSGFGFAAGAALHPAADGKKQGRAKQVLLGLVIALPVTLLAGALLVEADAGVERIVLALFDRVFFGLFDWLLMAVVGIPVACYLFGMLLQNTRRAGAQRYTPQALQVRAARRRGLPNLAAYVALSPVLLLYAVFFLSQSQYFLSAFAGRLPQGMGYADYARRGFFELFALAVVNLALLYALNRLTVNGRRTRPLVVYNTLLCLSTLGMIAVALSKMVMYITRFGLTRLRLYTSWSMLFLAVVFGLLLARQFAARLKVARIGLAVFVGMFALLCFSQSDYWIARFNVEMYNSGWHSELDVDYLYYGLSDDALGYVLENCDLRETVYSPTLSGAARSRMEQAQDAYGRFAHYNLASALADRRMAQLLENPALTLTVRLPQQVAQEIDGLRYELYADGCWLGSAELTGGDVSGQFTLFVTEEELAAAGEGAVSVYVWVLMADGGSAEIERPLTLSGAAEAELCGSAADGYTLRLC